MRETADAVVAFEQYYDMEDRSLEKLAQLMHQKQSDRNPMTILAQLKRWSASHGWQKRCIDREMAQAEKERQKRQKEIEAMNSRHAMIGTTQQAKAMKQIEALIEAKKFGSQAVVQLLKLGLDIERLARGDATDRQEITGKDGKTLGGNSVVVYLPDNGRDREGGQE
jgi:hypothetical protein